MAKTKNHLQVWEYPKGSGIKIRERINPDGGVSHRIHIPLKVTGGKPIIKQFKDKNMAFEWAEDKLAEYRRSQVAAKALNDQTKLQAAEAIKLLKEREIGEPIDDVIKKFLDIQDRLAGHNITLNEAAEFAIERLRPEGGDKTVPEVVDELVASKTRRHEKGDLRDRSLKDFKTRSKRFAAFFGETLIKKITHQEIKDWLLSMDLSFRSTKNYRMVTGEVFKYARQKNYVAVNPMELFTAEDRKAIEGGSDNGREPNILTIKEAERLIKTAFEHPELDLQAAVTLALFCGIRTEELKRMEWSEVRLDEKPPIVIIPREKAKRRRIRHSTIPSNAVTWLKECLKDTGPITRHNHATDYDKRFRKLQQLAGFGATDEKGNWRSTWNPNNMRHSFGTYDYALHGDPIRTAQLLGHKATDDVLFEHYRALATKKDGAAYFKIRPPKI